MTRIVNRKSQIARIPKVWNSKSKRVKVETNKKKKPKDAKHIEEKLKDVSLSKVEMQLQECNYLQNIKNTWLIYNRHWYLTNLQVIILFLSKNSQKLENISIELEKLKEKHGDTIQKEKMNLFRIELDLTKTNKRN